MGTRMTPSNVLGVASALGTALAATVGARAWRALVDADPACTAVDGPGDGLSSAFAGTVLALRTADHLPAA